MDAPQFSSSEEEIKYWKSQATDFKERYEEVKEELEEFQLSSQELEAELEATLEQAESKNKELNASKCRLEMEVDSLREKLEKSQTTSHRQLTELEDELAQVAAHRDELLKYIRGLEQSNDDLERAKRTAVASLEDFEMRLNQAIERNAFLESELDDKESLAITVQRLKDEARDLRQEMAVTQPTEKMKTPEKETLIDKKKVDGLGPTEMIDSNRIAEEITTNNKTPLKPNLLSHTSCQSPLSPSSRISALNIVGDLLRKVGALETKLASCKNFVSNQQTRSAKAGANSPLNSPRRTQRQSIPSYTRAKRLHRAGDSLQSDSSSTQRSSQGQGYVNVKVTI